MMPQPDRDAGPAAGGCDPRTLRQGLRVVAVEGAFIRVEAERSTGCANCAVRAGCGAGALAELLGAAPHRMRLPYSGAVAPGDQAIVAISGSVFLGAAGLAYLLPPTSLVLGAAGLSTLGVPDWGVALACLPIFAVSLIPVRRAERRGRLAKALHVVEIVPGTQRSP